METLQKTQIKQLKSKDQRFETELFPFADALYNYALSLSKSPVEAQDLVQEAYFRAYKYFGYYETGTNAKAWLFKIMYNIFINDYRKKSKRPETDDIDEVLLFRGKELTTDKFLVDVLDNGVGDEVNMALQSLRPEHRKIVILKDIEGFKYHEIAEIMDLPIGTVKSWLFKARQHLKQALKSYVYSRTN